MMKSILLTILVLNSSISFGLTLKEIKMKHMPNGDKCVLCHVSMKDPKKLHLRDGTPVPVTDVDMQCRQCHGLKRRRWEEGRHGKISASWQSDKRKRLTCIECHNPHAPKFPQYKAIAPHLSRGQH